LIKCKVNANDPWGSNRDARLSLVDTLANIGDKNSLVILKQVAQDPIYGHVLQNFLASVVAFSGQQMRQDVVAGESTILHPVRSVGWNRHAIPSASVNWSARLLNADPCLARIWRERANYP
jgi:hypothetical protein